MMDFFLDADEELSSELRTPCWGGSRANRILSYEMARLTWYLGAWILIRMVSDFQRSFTGETRQAFRNDPFGAADFRRKGRPAEWNLLTTRSGRSRKRSEDRELIQRHRRRDVFAGQAKLESGHVAGGALELVQNY